MTPLSDARSGLAEAISVYLAESMRPEDQRGEGVLIGWVVVAEVASIADGERWFHQDAGSGNSGDDLPIWTRVGMLRCAQLTDEQHWSHWSSDHVEDDDT